MYIISFIKDFFTISLHPSGIFSNRSQVARETGFSAGTVKKYIIPDWKPIDENTIQKFNQPLPEFDTSIFRLKNWGKLCELSDEEKIEVKKLQEEISI